VYVMRGSVPRHSPDLSFSSSIVRRRSLHRYPRPRQKFSGCCANSLHLTHNFTNLSYDKRLKWKELFGRKFNAFSWEGFPNCVSNLGFTSSMAPTSPALLPSRKPRLNALPWDGYPSSATPCRMSPLASLSDLSDEESEISHHLAAIYRICDSEGRIVTVSGDGPLRELGYRPILHLPLVSLLLSLQPPASQLIFSFSSLHLQCLMSLMITASRRRGSQHSLDHQQ
jgi:hypothetical protein